MLSQRTLPSLFVPFCLEYKRDDGNDSKTQARSILEEVKRYNKSGYKKVGITYSANADQSANIRKTYASAQWCTNTNGSNQASVINEIENLLSEDEFKEIQDVFRILPITTCAKPGGQGKVDDNLLKIDLDSITDFLKSDSCVVLGWKNQDSVKKIEGPYAIGGGISKELTDIQDKLIQKILLDLENHYKADPQKNYYRLVEKQQQNVPSDGNCFFWACARQLIHLLRSYPELINVLPTEFIEKTIQQVSPKQGEVTIASLLNDSDINNPYNHPSDYTFITKLEDLFQKALRQSLALKLTDFKKETYLIKSDNELITNVSFIRDVLAGAIADRGNLIEISSLLENIESSITSKIRDDLLKENNGTADERSLQIPILENEQIVTKLKTDNSFRVSWDNAIDSLRIVLSKDGNFVGDEALFLMSYLFPTITFYCEIHNYEAEVIIKQYYHNKEKTRNPIENSRIVHLIKLPWAHYNSASLHLKSAVIPGASRLPSLNEGKDKGIHNNYNAHNTNNNNNIDVSTKKNHLVSSALSGISYQAKIMMIYAFDAFISDKKFRLRSEVEGFGKFDDLVIYYDDRIEVLQAKHANSVKDNKYTLEMLINPENEDKKAGFPLYFDSWIALEEERKREPEKFENKPIKYVYYTNHILDSSDELDTLYDDEKKCFKDDFISGENLNDNQKQIRAKIINAIYQNSTAIRKEEKREEEILKNFEIDLSAEKDNTKNNITKIGNEFQDCLKKAKNNDLELDRKNTPELVGILFYWKDDILELQKKGKKDFYRFKTGFIDSKNLTECQNLFRDSFRIPKNEIKNILIRFENKDKLKLNRNKILGKDFKLGNNKAKWVVPKDFALYVSILFEKYEGSKNVSDKSHPLNTYYDRIQKIVLNHPDLTAKVYDGTELMPPRIKEFFEQFNYKIAEPNEKELTEQLENKINKKFLLTDRIFYLSFYERMLQMLMDNQNETFDETKLNTLFENAKIQLEKQHLVGHAERFRHHLRFKHQFYIPDLEVKNENIKSSLTSHNSIVIIHSKDVDLSTLYLFQLFYAQEYHNDTYAFIDSSYAALPVDPSVFENPSFKFMAISYAENLLRNDKDLLDKHINAAIKSQKKLILLCHSNSYQDVEILSKIYIENPLIIESDINSLDKIQVSAILNQTNCKEKYVSLGGKKHKIGDILNNTHTSLFNAMCNPRLLASIVAEAIDNRQETKPKEILSSDEERNNIFVPPVIQQLSPFYLLDDLFRSRLSFCLYIPQEDFKQASDDFKKNESIIDINIIKFKTILEKNKSYDLDKVVCNYYEKYVKQNHEYSSYKEKVLFFDNIDDFLGLSPEIQHSAVNFRCFLIAREKREIQLPDTIIKLNLLKSNNQTKFQLENISNFGKMPSAKHYFMKSTLEGNGYKELLKKEDFPQQRIIVSSYGSGKSKLMSQLKKEFYSTDDRNDMYSWVIVIPFRKIKKSDNMLPLSSLILNYIGSPLHDYEKFCLDFDIEKNNVMLLLDGWDEIKENQRQECKILLDTLFRYPNLIITSRPSDEAFIPINPIEHLRLNPFDEAKIDQFVNHYFSDSGRELIHKVKELLVQNKDKKTLRLLGKPLLCRIACDTVNSDISAFHGQEILISGLFQKFIEASLIKFHRYHNYIPRARLTTERVYNLSHSELKRMCEIAYSSMFSRGIDCIESNIALDQDLTYIALMKPIGNLPITNAEGYEFDHQTIAEYFTAVHLVKLFETDLERVKKIIQDNLLHSRYSVVWQFIAGMVTSGEIMVPKAQDFCLNFLNILYESSEDLVGINKEIILNACFNSANFDNLQKSIENSPLNLLQKDEYAKFVEMYKKLSFEIGKEKTGNIEKNIFLENIYLEDEVIVESSKYTRGILKKSDLDKNGYCEEISILSSDDLRSYYDHHIEYAKKYFEKEKNTIKANQAIFQLALLAIEIHNRSLSDAKESEIIIKDTVDCLLNIYLSEKTPSNNSYYQAAYYGICELLDNKVISLDQDLANKLSTDFMQKVTHSDVIKRLKKGDFIDEIMIKKIFVFNRDSRGVLFDYNVGIPAVLYLKDRLNEDIADYLIKNIISRNDGDWEINSAYEVLERLSSFHYEDLNQVNVFIKILCNINHAKCKRNSETKDRVNAQDSMYEKLINNIISNFRFENLIMLIWDSYTKLNLNFDNFSLVEQKIFYLRMLFDIAFKYKFSVCFIDNALNWSSDIISPLVIPNEAKERYFIVHNFRNFKLLKNEKEYTKLVEEKNIGSYDPTCVSDLYRYLCRLFDYFYLNNLGDLISFPLVKMGVGFDDIEHLETRLDKLQLSKEEWRIIFDDLQKQVDECNKNSKLRNEIYVKKLIKKLNILPKDIIFDVGSNFLKLCQDNFGGSVWKDLIPCYTKLAAHTGFACELFNHLFTDIKNKYENLGNYWHWDAGILSSCLVGNHFNERTYNYLHSFFDVTLKTKSRCSAERFRVAENLVENIKNMNLVLNDWVLKILAEIQNDDYIGLYREEIKQILGKNSSDLVEESEHTVSPSRKRKTSEISEVGRSLMNSPKSSTSLIAQCGIIQETSDSSKISPKRPMLITRSPSPKRIKYDPQVADTKMEEARSFKN